MKHGIEPPRAETLEELGTELGKLRYDALARVLVALANELQRQEKTDWEKGRPKLAKLGCIAGQKVWAAAKSVDSMFSFSASFMRSDLVKHPLRK